MILNLTYFFSTQEKLNIWTEGLWETEIERLQLLEALPSDWKSQGFFCGFIFPSSICCSWWLAWPWESLQGHCARGDMFSDSWGIRIPISGKSLFGWLGGRISLKFKTQLCHFLPVRVFFYGSLVALQSCVSFCSIPKWVSHRYTYIPSLSPQSIE